MLVSARKVGDFSEQLAAARQALDEGRYTHYRTLLDEVLPLIQSEGTLSERITVLANYGRNLVWSGSVKKGWDLTQEAWLLAQEEELPPTTLVDLYHDLSEVYIAIGKFKTAYQSWLKAPMGQITGEERVINAKRLEWFTLYKLGRWAESLDACSSYYEISQQAGSILNMTRALRNEALSRIFLAQSQGNLEGLDKVYQLIQRAREIMHQANNVDATSAVAYGASVCLELMGRLEESREITLSGLANTRECNYLHREVLMTRRLAQIEYLCGDRTTALALIDKGLKLAYCDGAPFYFGADYQLLLRLKKDFQGEEP